MTQSEEQARDLIAFEKSISRPVIRWPHRSVHEPRLHREWRFYAGVARRFELYRAAGMELLPGMTTQFFEIDLKERSSRIAWRAYKRRVEAEYMSGRRKRAPCWLCC